MQLLLILCLAFDLAAIRMEPNLERRSERAMDNAAVAMDAARDAAREGAAGGDQTKLKAGLQELGDSVELAYHSLVESGKVARKNPRFFKSAELKTRELMRRLTGLEQAVDGEDRALVGGVRDRVSKVHDELIQDIMRKK